MIKHPLKIAIALVIPILMFFLFILILPVPKLTAEEEIPFRFPWEGTWKVVLQDDGTAWHGCDPDWCAIDFTPTVTSNEKVISLSEGTVTEVRTCIDPEDIEPDSANVTIEATNGRKFTYAHLLKSTLNSSIKVNSEVAQGDLISTKLWDPSKLTYQDCGNGYGSTSSGGHLHLAINKHSTDPNETDLIFTIDGWKFEIGKAKVINGDKIEYLNEAPSFTSSNEENVEETDPTDPPLPDTWDHIVGGVFNNSDSYGEVSAMYKETNGTMKMFMFRSNGIDTYTRKTWFLTPDNWPYNWSVDDSEFISSGNYNGDYFDDVAVIYRNPSNDPKAWVFRSEGTKFVAEEWLPALASWGMDYIKFAASGDFDGNGYDDLAVIYKVNGNDPRIWVFESNGSSFTPVKWRDLPSWGLDHIHHITSGDFDGDGDDDLAIIYRVDTTYPRIWVLRSEVSSEGKTFVPEIWNDVLRSGWNIYKIYDLTAGDFNNDGNDDLALVYRLTDGLPRFWVFASNGNSFPTHQDWNSPSGWNIDKIKDITTSDVDYDGDDDLTLMYELRTDTMRLWVFKSNGSSAFSKSYWYTSADGAWKFYDF